MVKNQASPKHRAIQKLLEQAIDDTYPPSGNWKCVEMRPEFKGMGPGGEYRFDLYVRYFCSSGRMSGRYEVFYEIQKDLNEPDFKLKWEDLKKWEDKHCKYQLIKEEEVPDRWDEMLAYLKDKVVVPW
jgi:hypothetical protein